MIMELNSVLVTGANRGIGLEFVRQLSRLPKPPRFTFATYRSEDSLEPLTEIKNSSRECQVILIKMDVNIPEDVVAARKVIEMFETVGENGITLLINNAGTLKFEAFPNITEENLLYHFTTNTVGPIRVFQEMLPLLQKAASHSSGGMRVSRAAVLNISSVTGCIARTGVEFTQDLIAPGYKMSKAALHMAMRVISSNVKDQGILVICMCPGWVKTDMGTNHGKITPEESISTMLQTLQKLDDSHHGSFMDRFGNLCQF